MRADPEQARGLEPKSAAATSGWLPRLFPWLVLGMVCVSAGIRLAVAWSVPVMLQPDPVGVLRTDPALIYYVTERLVDNGGWPPADFRADPRIEHPDTSDIPAMFTVGQEFLVAWCYLLAAGNVPLHVVAIVVMSFFASLTLVGVACLARELTRSAGSGLLAGLLFLTATASYRTIGSILVREDLSLPFFALHLFLLVRAHRRAGTAALVLAALAAVAALASWHAMSFVFAVEAACLFAWFLRTGENIAGGRRAWLFLAVLLVGALAVPVLRSKLFPLSTPVQMLAAMCIAPVLGRVSPRGGPGRAAAGLVSFAALAVACAGVAGWLAPGAGDYAHVVEMMLYKLRHLGELPADPNALSYGARLLWQGPFQTSSPTLLVNLLGAMTFLVPVAAVGSLEAWWRGRGDGAAATLTAFAAAALVLTLMVHRLMALSSLLAPVVAATLLWSSFRGRRRAQWVAGLLIVQLALVGTVLNDDSVEIWYKPRLVEQLGSTLRWVQRELPGDGAIAADFVTSAALLAHTTHPVVLQPKYETARSRERIERFTVGLFAMTPVEFRTMLRSEFEVRYLLVDSPFLWGTRYEAGLRSETRAPPRHSAAFRLLHKDAAVYGDIPGYRLLFESGPPARFRLYELADGGGTPEAAR